MNENQNEYADINVHDNYPDSEQKIEIPTMKVIPLKKICMTIGALPTSYLETLSYYETLVWFIEFLKNNIIPTINNNASAIQEVQSVVLALQNYINDYKDSIDSDVEELEDYMNNYFENLDVQDEINNKLDEMLEDGVLTEIIQQFLQSTAIWCFDTVADMKNATNLINGSYAQTLGYYATNDGGGATYKITNTESETEYQEQLNNGLYASLIGNKIKLKQIGSQNNTDISDLFTKALNLYKIIEIDGDYILSKDYNINHNLKLYSNNNNKLTVNKNNKNNPYDNFIGIYNAESKILIENIEFEINVLNDLFLTNNNNRYQFLFFDSIPKLVKIKNITININGNNNEINLFNGGGLACNNLIIENSNINLNTSGRNAGLLWFRPSTNGTNVNINNSTFKQNCHDEIYAVFGEGGTYKGYINNSVLESNSSNQTVMINSTIGGSNGANQLSSFNNCLIKNSQTSIALSDTIVNKITNARVSDSISIISFNNCDIEIANGLLIGGDNNVSFLNSNDLYNRLRIEFNKCNINLLNESKLILTSKGCDVNFNDSYIIAHFFIDFNEYSSNVLPKHYNFNNCKLVSTNSETRVMRMIPAQGQQAVFKNCYMTNFSIPDNYSASLWFFNKSGYTPTKMFEQNISFLILNCYSDGLTLINDNLFNS